MRKETRFAAFEGGELHVLADDSAGREVVLALPLSRILVKVLRVPEGQDPAEFALPVMKVLSPYPDEPLAVSCETVRDSAEGKVVIAAALPEESASDVAEALDAAKLNVVKIDALAFGALRQVWGELLSGPGGDDARRLAVLKSPDCTSLVVLDGDMPVSVRAVAPGADMKRETMLSLLEAEDFAGPKELAGTFERDEDVDAALAGVKERAEEDDSLDVLPDSWREVLVETRFKAKLSRNLAAAGLVWALVMGVLFGVPVAYGFMTDHVKGLCRQHAKQYKAVADKKAKTELVRKYSDHDRGALEILKAVSDRLPEGITLASWEFTRGDSVRIRGEAEDKGAVYELKDRLVAVGGEDGGEPVFAEVNLGAVSSQKDGRQKFELECRFQAAEE
ncbi:MAG: PilN domain-containing protein [Kiritimatiellae bacterium]|nr:PilN domain-containing protein [Kiritimatiellia bacterium]